MECSLIQYEEETLMKQKFLIPCLSLLLMSISFAEKPLQEAWEAPEEAKTAKNPNSPNKKSIKNAESIYKLRCAICHGEVGKGDGLGARALNPKPADHTSEELHLQTDGELFWKISNGRGAMTGWGNGTKPLISVSDRWDLVNYIRSLRGK